MANRVRRERLRIAEVLRGIASERDDDVAWSQLNELIGALGGTPIAAADPSGLLSLPLGPLVEAMLVGETVEVGDIDQRSAEEINAAIELAAKRDDDELPATDPSIAPAPAAVPLPPVRHMDDFEEGRLLVQGGMFKRGLTGRLR